jgi:hypothetical protein
MKVRQRKYLAKRFDAWLKDIETDVGPDGTLGPGNARDVRSLRPMIAWLEGKATDPGPCAHEFLQERLEAFKDTVGWEELAYEHDALVAAVEACE